MSGKLNSITKIVLYLLFIFSFDIQSSLASSDNLSEVTILIPSCDKYAELWDPHFKLLFKHWPELKTKHEDIPIILISNQKTYDDNRVSTLKIYPEISWSDNMLTALEQVKTKYVIIILEDYIINSDVNEQVLSDIVSFMNKTDAVYTGLSIDPDLSLGRQLANFPGLVVKDHFDKYRTSLQTSIWNKADLKWLLKPGESIWYFEEINGNTRSQGMSRPFYLVNKDPVFSYLNAAYKGLYRKTVVDYINNQGISFHPKQFPIVSDYILNHHTLFKIRRMLNKYLKY